MKSTVNAVKTVKINTVINMVKLFNEYLEAIIQIANQNICSAEM